MKIRELQETDALLMYEWMQDDDITENLYTDFKSKTIEDCKAFIRHAQTEKDKHWAIASDMDEYMGTVSIKNIDEKMKNAEFAITIRKKAMRKGYAWFGMIEILKIAFEKLQLKNIYWCVSEKNVRACKFYDKHGFHEMYDVPETILERYKKCEDLKWYSVLQGDDYQNIALVCEKVTGCSMVNIETISTMNSGELSFFEGGRKNIFDIKRVYYISKVPEGVRRGYHAHKGLKQLLFCPYGEIQIILDDGVHKEEVMLNDPSIGVLIEKPVWREMLWIQTNSVLCVAASEYYNPEDYIRDYDSFLKYIKIDRKGEDYEGTFC